MSDLTPLENDTLREMMNIASGRAANALAQLLHTRVHLSVIELYLLQPPQLQPFAQRYLEVQNTFIRMRFRNHLNGHTGMVLPEAQVQALLQLLQNAPDVPPSLCEEPAALLRETGNIILNALLGVLSNMLQVRLQFELPQVYLGLDRATTLERLLPTLPPRAGSVHLLLTNRLQIEQLQMKVTVLIVLVMPEKDIQQVIEKLLHGP